GVASRNLPKPLCGVLCVKLSQPTNLRAADRAEARVHTRPIRDREPQLGVPEPAGEEPNLHRVGRLRCLPRRHNGAVSEGASIRAGLPPQRHQDAQQRLCVCDAVQGTKTILTYEFEKDLVRGTIHTQIEAAPKYSSAILTLMRRIGDCPR